MAQMKVPVSELDDAALCHLMSRPIYAELLNKPYVRGELVQRMSKLQGVNRAQSSIKLLDRVTLVTAAGMLENALQEYLTLAKDVSGDVIKWAVTERTFPLREIFEAMAIANRISITTAEDAFIELGTLSILFSVLYSTRNLKDAVSNAIICFFGHPPQFILRQWDGSSSKHRKKVRRTVLLLNKLIADCGQQKEKLFVATAKVQEGIPIRELVQKLKKFRARNENASVPFTRVLQHLTTAQLFSGRDSSDMLEFRGRNLFTEQERGQARSIRKRSVHERGTDEDNSDYNDDKDFGGSASYPESSCRPHHDKAPLTRPNKKRKIRRTRSNKDTEESDSAGEESGTKEVSSDVRQRLEELNHARAILQDTVGEDVLEDVVEQSRKARRRRSMPAGPDNTARTPSPFTDEEDGLGAPPTLPSVKHKKFPKTIRDEPPPARGARKQRFTGADDVELYNGMRRYGYGRWKKILEAGNFSEHITNVRLKDRARQLGVRAQDFPLPRGTHLGSGRPNVNLRFKNSKRGGDESTEDESEIENPDSEHT